MSLLKPNKSRERCMVGIYIERMPFFRPKSEREVGNPQAVAWQGWKLPVKELRLDV